MYSHSYHRRKFSTIQYTIDALMQDSSIYKPKIHILLHKIKSFQTPHPQLFSLNKTQYIEPYSSSHIFGIYPNYVFIYTYLGTHK